MARAINVTERKARWNTSWDSCVCKKRNMQNTMEQIVYMPALHVAISCGYCSFCNLLITAFGLRLLLYSPKYVSEINQELDLKVETAKQPDKDRDNQKNGIQ